MWGNVPGPPQLGDTIARVSPRFSFLGLRNCTVYLALMEYSSATRYIPLRQQNQMLIRTFQRETELNQQR